MHERASERASALSIGRDQSQPVDRLAAAQTAGECMTATGNGVTPVRRRATEECVQAFFALLFFIFFSAYLLFPRFPLLIVNALKFLLLQQDVVSGLCHIEVRTVRDLRPNF